MTCASLTQDVLMVPGAQLSACQASFMNRTCFARLFAAAVCRKTLPEEVAVQDVSPSQFSLQPPRTCRSQCGKVVEDLQSLLQECSTETSDQDCPDGSRQHTEMIQCKMAISSNAIEQRCCAQWALCKHTQCFVAKSQAELTQA